MDIINQPAMGIGKLGGPAVLLRHNRISRWTVEGEFAAGKFGPYWVRVSPIPIPGDTTTKITLHDVTPDTTKDLWVVLAALYDAQADKADPAIFTGQITLRKYDGCGTPLGAIKLADAWFASFYFGELDHSSTETHTVELELRFAGVEVL